MPDDEATPAPRQLPSDGTVLAFDYGEKKIGVALGNFVTREARALVIIPNITVSVAAPFSHGNAGPGAN